MYIITGWWFQTCFIFQNMWDNPSHWLIFFKMVKTTNQIINIYIYILYTRISIRWWRIINQIYHGLSQTHISLIYQVSTITRDPPAIIYQEHPEDFPSYNGLTRQSYFMITEHVFPKLNWPESQNQSSFALPKVKNWNPKLAKSSGKLYRHIQTTD